ncbi:Dullard phosphatase domain, eukaryotic [Artemisia annua]|uniref:Dullard phosphatase domain, eukaryotic n=1 Tax=Artemisia annua TaxID=35608 RepID=A0A2U1NW07_ARTAN|nr:Dullard phosphatase domain, eukaryotic [Artemisia annua]PWA77664.1 Dullard phosphatase domain, eukaryotic [Artemisia annua]
MSTTFRTRFPSPMPLRRSPRFAGNSTNSSTNGPSPCALPPPTSPNQKTVFLDLDHTLITSVWCPPSPRTPRTYDFLVKFDQQVRYVIKRPYVDEFLNYLNNNNFEIVIFTAGKEACASPTLDKLDPKGLISHRLYRSSCKILDGGRLAKDLSDLGRNLKNVVIIDDIPSFYRLQPENGIRITPFTYNNARDDELKKLMDKFFDKCEQYEDLKDALKHLGAKNLKKRKRLK